MNEKTKKLFKNKTYKLATIKEGNYLLYVDNLKAWEKDTEYGEYNESIDSVYKKIIIKIDGTSFDVESESNCIGRYYGLKSILSDIHCNSNKIAIGSTLSDLYVFITRVKGTSHLYVPYNYVQTKKSLQRADLKLCYVDDGIAYFTNNPEQWGDDWNDSPYQYNAGTPYLEEGYEVVNISFYTPGQYQEPCDYFYHKSFSVEQINHKFVPWLIPEDIKYSPIFSGDTIKSFIEKIEQSNGCIMCGLKFENYDI